MKWAYLSIIAESGIIWLLNSMIMDTKIEDGIKLRKCLTQKQAKFMRKLQENDEEPIGKLMIESGYSPQTAKTPSKITQSAPFKQFFQSRISNAMVVRAHKKLLNAKVRVKTYKKGELVTEYVTDDTLGISKGVDLAYKVMGAFAPVETKHTITGLESKSEDELAEMMREEQNTLNRSSKYTNKPIEGEIVKGD
jgi:light-regulated signal transduction histidine kinase (bacteriophytochrome)